MKVTVWNTTLHLDQQWQLDVVPDNCPICHHGVEPVLKAAFGVSDFPDQVFAQLAYQCPKHKCRKLFIATYEPKSIVHAAMQLGSTEFVLTALAPRRFQKEEFADEVTDVSAAFVDIYNQAKAAEEFGLVDIAGPGYGKALEFLIKDFLIRERPTEAAAIKRDLLGSVSKNRVDDANIRATAERAAWLRNDETHYERKWQDKDLADLKRLVTLTANWIHSTLLTRKITSDMSTGKR